MRVLTVIECSGGEVVMEVNERAELIFHDYDIEADAAAAALGFEPSECLKVYDGWEVAQSTIFIQRFALDGDVWFAILVAWLENVAWTYQSLLELDDHVRDMLGAGPLEVLATARQHVDYGLELSRGETLAMGEAVVADARDKLNNEVESYLEEHYAAEVSSLLSAANAFLKGLRNLVLFSPGFGPRMLSTTASLRKEVADAVFEARYLINFMKVRAEAKGRRSQNAMFLEASAQTGKDVDGLIRQAVKVAHGME